MRSGSELTLRLALRQYASADPILARVLRQASYQHHARLGKAIVGWRRAAQLIFAQVCREAAFGSGFRGLRGP
eukprot:11132646-Lingulodinium_polyedra.AAC.1